MQTRQDSSQLNFTCFPAIIFPSADSSHTQIFRNGWRRQHVTLILWESAGSLTPGASQAQNVRDVQAYQLFQESSLVPRARCCRQPSAACYCYSRRGATPETAERTSWSERQEHSCPGHHPLARTFYCWPGFSALFKVISSCP